MTRRSTSICRCFCPGFWEWKRGKDGKERAIVNIRPTPISFFGSAPFLSFEITRKILAHFLEKIRLLNVAITYRGIEKEKKGWHF
jgi:hypothetical protein